VSRTRLVLDFLTRGRVHSYGPQRSQRADLYLPLGAGPHPGDGHDPRRRRAHVDPRSQAWTAVTRWLGQPAGL
jgi:hypothetical protein